MLMFLVSNLVGSTVQLTTLPLPVLSTLQAVGHSHTVLIYTIAESIPGRPRLQLNMRLPHPRGALHTLVVRGYCPCMHRRCTDRHLRGHWRASTQSQPAAELIAKTSIHHMDGLYRYCRHCHHCIGQAQQAPETMGETSSSDALLQGNGLRCREWYTLCPYPTSRQVCC